jgi:BirA family transcriptional regulator, biotin operon repressor / biotin---[acetyl-CoA-carboxylase] ligase
MALNWQIPGRRVEHFSTIGSTMDRAFAAIEEGLPAGSVFVADSQTQGRGRQDHAWHSPPTVGLYFSVLLAKQETPAPQITFLLGLAVRDAIRELTEISLDLKWPNDLFFHGKKVSGILVQTHSSVPVAGIGINVLTCQRPSDIQQIATSLQEISGRTVDRLRLLQTVLDCLDRWQDQLRRGGVEAIVEEFARGSSFVSGRRVSVELPHRWLEGVTCGLANDGTLLVKDEMGKVHPVVAGSVHWTS